MKRAWLVGLLAILLTLIPVTAFAGTVVGGGVVPADPAEDFTVEQGSYLDVKVSWTYEGTVGEGRYFRIPSTVTIGAGGSITWSESYLTVEVPKYEQGHQPVRPSIQDATVRVFVAGDAPLTTDTPYTLTVPYLSCYSGDGLPSDASISCTEAPPFSIIVEEPEDDGDIVEIGPIKGIHIPGNKHQSGSTIPVKVDVGGELPEDWSVILAVYGEDESELSIEGSGKSGDSFRYDEEAAQYILNVSTEGWAADTYTFTVKVLNGEATFDELSVDVEVVVSGQGKEKGNRGGNEASNAGGNRPETSPANGGKAEPQGKATGRTR